MTLFGTDVSGHQGRIDFGRLWANGFRYVVIKCTQGRSFVSDDYAWQVERALEAGFLTAVYHFLEHHNRASIASQVDNLVRHIGDLSLPVAVDSETWGDPPLRPTDTDIKDFVRIARERGLKVTLLYAQGAEFLPGGMAKWHANYGGNATGFASVVYAGLGGDDASRWRTSIPTTIWQFGSNIKPWSGYAATIDGNAFRGTFEQLDAMGLFKNPKGDDMPITDADAERIATKVWAHRLDPGPFAERLGGYPAGETYPAGALLVGADTGSREDRAWREQLPGTLTAAVRDALAASPLELSEDQRMQLAVDIADRTTRELIGEVTDGGA